MSLFKKNNYDGLLRYETYINSNKGFISQPEIEEIGYYIIQKDNLCRIIAELESKQYKVISELDFDNGDFKVEAIKEDTTKDIKITKRFKLMNKKVK